MGDNNDSCNLQLSNTLFTGTPRLKFHFDTISIRTAVEEELASTTSSVTGAITRNTQVADLGA